jgi:hypothetical protein
MYFVISGYLIASNAARRRASLGAINARAFHGLRIARISPRLILLLVAVNMLALGGVAIFQNHVSAAVPTSFWLVNLASLTFWMNVLIGTQPDVLSPQAGSSLQEGQLLPFQDQAGQFTAEDRASVDVDAVGENLRPMPHRRVAMHHHRAEIRLGTQEGMADAEQVVLGLAAQRHARPHSGMGEEVVTLLVEQVELPQEVMLGLWDA